MINPWLNGLVVGVFGFLTGAVLGFYGIVTEAARSIQQEALRRKSAGRKARESRPWTIFSIKEFFEIYELSNAEREAYDKLMPRSGWMAMLSFFGLIAVTILFIKFSPLTMNWWAFLGAFFAGFVAAKHAFESARAGKLKPSSK
jgi:hypothetical protein